MPGKSVAPDSTRVIRLARISSRTERPRRGGSAQWLFLRSPKVRGSIMSEVARRWVGDSKVIVSQRVLSVAHSAPGSPWLDKPGLACSFAPRASGGRVEAYPRKLV